MDYSKIYINGKWVKPLTDQMIPVENPATREIIARVPSGSKEDVDAAIAAAAEAFAPWREVPMEKKIALFEKALEIFSSYQAELLDLEIKELGAPINWAKKAHILGPIKRFEHYVKIAKDFEFSLDLPRSRVEKEPYGVVACLTPWNYPLGQIMHKIIPAMLVGNTVVLKPSQNTPLTAYYLCQAFQEAGLPPGVLNMVTGEGAKVGSYFTLSPFVSMVSFTGSTLAGKQVAKQSLDTLKKFTLELGGKSPLILLRGGDVEQGVKAAMDSVFYNTGQTCAAFTRLLVPNEFLKEAEEAAKKFYGQYTVGDPTKEETHIGPLVSKSQFNKVRDYIKSGIVQGADMIIGEVPEDDSNGYFVKPVVFSRVDTSMKIAQDEIFGPVLSIMPYNTEEEAIQIANDTIYGLSSGIIGPVQDAERLSKYIKAGDVYINAGKWDPNAPFGGFKQSGIGREGGYFGMEEFVQLKTIYDK